jgi:hypothetical protein
MLEVVSFTGPTDAAGPEATFFVAHAISEAGPAAEYRTGAAYGIDTIAFWAAISYDNSAVHRICYPAGEWYNRELLARIRAKDGPGAVLESVSGGYMKRNDRLVDGASMLLAFPETPEEQRRSGTWATIRRARKAGVEVRLYPLSEAL